MAEFLISVLHVDDEDVFLELTKKYMERSGVISIDSAASAFDAIKKLEKQSYDVIISDYQMPGMNGIGLLKHVRQSDKKIPFILFTGRGKEEVAIEALNNGADYYIQKGIHWKSEFVQLEHEIKESVRRRRVEEQQKKIEAILKIKDAAVQSALSPIIISDLEGNIIYANPACMNAWDLSCDDEIEGKKIQNFIASPEYTGNIMETLRRERKWSGEAALKKRDGLKFDALINVSLIEGNDGLPFGFVGSFADLTDQKLAQYRIESYLADLKFISDKAMEMADYPVEGNFYEFIADCLGELLPKDILIFVNSVNHDTGMVRVEAARRVDPFLPMIEESLGCPLSGMNLTASDDAFKGMLLGSFLELQGGIKELLFGSLPDQACNQLENLPVVGKIMAAGLSWKGRVNGTIILVLPPDTHLEHIDILDMFVRHASAVLQRRWAEEALKTQIGIE